MLTETYPPPENLEWGGKHARNYFLTLLLPSPLGKVALPKNRVMSDEEIDLNRNLIRPLRKLRDTFPKGEGLSAVKLLFSPDAVYGSCSSNRLPLLCRFF